ncbi:DNA polymerase [Candidatus Bathyarchaeota archaeon]|nr:DNA polymerase [Candidatus Bathyarchaeota archaeon]
MILLDVEYSGADHVKTVLRGRGKTIEDTEFLPYIYLLPAKGAKKAELPKNKVVGIEDAERIDIKKKIKAWKILFNHPKNVPAAREALKEFGELREADVPFVRRYMIDHGLMPLVEVLPEIRRGKKEIHDLKVLAFDIETLPEEGKDIGKSPVIMVSFWGEGIQKVIGWGDYNVKDIKKVEDEAELIREFLTTVETYAPEVIVGYNSDGFDWFCLRERAKELKIPFEINGEKVAFVKKGRDIAPAVPGIINVDLYVFIRNILAQYMESENLTLNTVASELIGEEKVKIGGAVGIEDAWKNDPELLYKYSLQDSKITYNLATEILPMLYSMAKIVGQTVFDVGRMSPGQVVEWLLMSRSFNEGMLAPNRPGYKEAASRRSITYEGAFVKEPIKGLHSPIAVCDFRSLYPTIIMAHNISPDTKGCTHRECKKNKAPSGTWFCTEKEGFIPKTIRALFEERMKLKGRLKELKRDSHEYKIIYTRQNALKLLLNSFYGYLGYANARWYNLSAAEAITSWARDYVIKLMKEASLHGFTVVYGDTDSVMLSSDGPNFEREVKRFMKEVNSKFPTPIRLELEGFFTSGVFVTKKRYALMRSDGALVVKGLERVRRDWSNLAREAQETVIRLVLNNRIEEAKRHVQTLVKELRTKETPMDKLVIRTQLTKLIGSYKQIGPHVKVAKDMKRLGRPVYPGMIVEYVVTPGKGSISNRSVPADTARDYDPDYYVDNQLLPAVMRIFEALGGDLEELRMKQSNLGRFF